MKRAIPICLILHAVPLSAGVYTAPRQFSILNPTDTSVEVYRNGTVHDAYLSPIDKDLTYGANFVMNYDVFKYRGYGLYWNNILHFDQSEDKGHIKHAGWQYDIGLTLYHSEGVNRVEVFHQHHSRHVLEEIRDTHFPVYDRYGIRLRIYP